MSCQKNYDQIVKQNQQLVEENAKYKKTITNGQNSQQNSINSFIDKRINKMLGFNLNICENYEQYIIPKYRNKIQIGWSIRIKDIIISDIKICSNKILEFTSLLSLEENKVRAIKFLKQLKELNGNATKLRETPLEPL